MKCVDRWGNEIINNDTQNRILAFLYSKLPGRLLLKPLIQPWISGLAGAVMDSYVSKAFIPIFIKACKINIREYEERKYISFNDFFTRRVKAGRRIIDKNPNHLIAPCDGKLTVYQIDKDSRFTVKNTLYSLQSLLRSRKLAKHYQDGTLLVFRLSVDDYHRYCYIDNGRKTKNYRINGVFHTVNPLANDVYPIYKENTREFSLLYSENFGKVLVMEVGALLVGRIVNYHKEAYVRRGEEKGRFEFGGSTIIVCLEKGRAVIDEDIVKNSENGIETRVRMGERIGIISKSLPGAAAVAASMMHYTRGSSS